MITPERLLTTICIAMDREGMVMTPEEIRSKSRTADRCAARQLYTFVARQYMGRRFETIGKDLCRHHSSCVHSEGRAIDMIESDGQIGRMFLHMTRILQLTVPDWLHVNTVDYPKVIRERPKKGRVRKEPVRATSVKTYEWTPEQKKLLKRFHREPGIALPEKVGMN